MVALSVLAGLLVGACGGGEPRHARAPSGTRVATTTATSDATTTSATTTSATIAGPKANDSSSVARGANASTYATTMNPATPAASAALRVATARCDREAACNNIGTGRAFGDRDECVSQIGHDVVAELSSEECPSGVATESLATCISEVESAPCGETTEGAGPSSCARERVCLR